MTEKYFVKRIDALEQRNKRVETDKAWETSWTRRLLIAGLTFVLLGGYLWILGVDKPLLNAVVPTTGYLLSTLAIQRIKLFWLKQRK